MRFVLVLALMVGCQHRHDVNPVTAAEANDFATKFAAAMLPCDEAKLAELIDGEAMAQKAEEAAHTREGRLSGVGLRNPRTLAHFLCIGQASTEGYRLLHMKTVGGESRPVMRRLARATLKPVVIVGYDELQLGKSDGKVRMIDLYSYVQGAWITESTRASIEALGVDGDDKAMAVAQTVNHARELAGQGKFTDALAALDTLPPAVHRTRVVQLMRVQLGEKISTEGYHQALDEMTKAYPDDPSLALMQIDGAFLRGDLDGALHAIDVLEQSTGLDPFQDAVRAEVLLKRGKPGDLELAATRADAAIKAEPTLAKGWWSRLDVAVRQKNFALAVETLQHLEQTFGVKFDEDSLRKIPGYPELLESPEYKSRGG